MTIEEINELQVQVERQRARASLASAQHKAMMDAMAFAAMVYAMQFGPLILSGLNPNLYLPDRRLGEGAARE